MRAGTGMAFARIGLAAKRIRRASHRSRGLVADPSAATIIEADVEMHDTKIARQSQVQVPAEICLRCFNQQQQFAFPFLVYCAHNEMLALFRSSHEYVTFVCAPEQLENVLHTLQKEARQSGSAAVRS